jgi:hypothetical protein
LAFAIADKIGSELRRSLHGCNVVTVPFRSVIERAAFIESKFVERHASAPLAENAGAAQLLPTAKKMKFGSALTPVREAAN